MHKTYAYQVRQNPRHDISYAIPPLGEELLAMYKRWERVSQFSLEMQDMRGYPCFSPKPMHVQTVLNRLSKLKK